jgi:SAM-dependent methyltransferase
MAALIETDTATIASHGWGRAITGDALHLPFADATFDRVIAAEVLEHIPADRAAMAELARVLRPGGTMAVTVPRWYPELVNWALSDDYHLVPGGHIRIYRSRDLTSRLEATGLELYGHHHAHAFHSPYWWLKCAVGVRDDQHPLVRAYHRGLVWDITSPNRAVRAAERILNPGLGKSLVVYLRKPPT